MTANASDPEGQLTRVEFLNGTTVLGTDTAAPYTFTWSSVPAGSYSLRAVAYDAAGASATSAAITVRSLRRQLAPRLVVFAASTITPPRSRTICWSIRLGRQPATATPVATSDLGKPAPASNNDITVDRWPSSQRWRRGHMSQRSRRLGRADVQEARP